ncbi:hypothetical protein COBT_001784 [Conglomerata obtusa]
MNNLYKSNKIIQTGDFYEIFINLSNDFEYDIENIVIEYHLKTNTIEIIHDLIPQNIKQNMLDYYENDIEDYVKFIENNIEAVLLGCKLEKTTYTQSTNNTVDKKNEMGLLNQIIEDKIEQLSITEKNTNKVSLEPTPNIECYLGFPKIITSFVVPNKKIKHLNIRYDNMRKNINHIFCNTIFVDVKCLKCTQTQTASSNIACVYCHTELTINFTPTLDKLYLGYLILESCILYALNPITFYLSCCICNTTYQTEKMGSDCMLVFNCFECDTELTFLLERLKYIDKIKAKLKTQDIVHNGGLPNFGTCKHDLTSREWYRYTCCNDFFPCKKCHNENNCHPIGVANKIMCGICSKEHITTKNCKCRSEKKTLYIEVGKDIKEKIKMNKKISKK